MATVLPLAYDYSMRRFCIAFTLMVAALVGPSAADATIVVPLTIEDLTVRSRAVVRATVRQRQSVWGKNRKRIFTLTELAVSEVIHGEAPKTILVRTLGGQVDGVGMKASGTPRMAEDQDVVIFLRDDPVDTAGFMVVGMSQGLYRLERDSAGRLLAVPGVEGLAFVRRTAKGGQQVDHETDAVRMPYDKLREKITAAASGPSPTPVVP